MVRKLSGLVCGKCGAAGGTLTLRKVSKKKPSGRVNHWYIGHYDPSKKYKKRWCHLGRENGPALSNVLLPAQEHNEEEYKKMVGELWMADTAYSYRNSGSILTRFLQLIREDPNTVDHYILLGRREMAHYKIAEFLKLNGWPDKWIDQKISADLEALNLEINKKDSPFSRALRVWIYLDRAYSSPSLTSSTSTSI